MDEGIECATRDGLVAGAEGRPTTWRALVQWLVDLGRQVELARAATYQKVLHGVQDKLHLVVAGPPSLCGWGRGWAAWDLVPHASPIAPSRRLKAAWSDCANCKAVAAARCAKG